MLSCGFFGSAIWHGVAELSAQGLTWLKRLWTRAAISPEALCPTLSSLVASRIQFLVVVGLISNFLASWQQGILLSSYRLPASFLAWSSTRRCSYLEDSRSSLSSKFPHTLNLLLKSLDHVRPHQIKSDLPRINSLSWSESIWDWIPPEKKCFDSST